MKKLKNITVAGNTVTAVFNISHNNMKTTLDQDLLLTRTGDGWVARMDMQEFPAQKTITASAWKLAEWFERLATEIKATEFDTLNLNDLDC